MWSDPPASPASVFVLVNNLDLWVADVGTLSLSLINCSYHCRFAADEFHSRLPVLLLRSHLCSVAHGAYRQPGAVLDSRWSCWNGTLNLSHFSALFADSKSSPRCFADSDLAMRVFAVGLHEQRGASVLPELERAACLQRACSRHAHSKGCARCALLCLRADNIAFFAQARKLSRSL